MVCGISSIVIKCLGRNIWRFKTRFKFFNQCFFPEVMMITCLTLRKNELFY